MLIKLKTCICVIFLICILHGECSAARTSLQQSPESNGHEQPQKLSASTNGAKISFEQNVHDFGQLNLNEKAKCEFKFKNTGTEQLTIGRIRTSCGCTVPTLDKSEYKPGERGVIKVSFNGQCTPGRMSKSITVPTNDSENKSVILKIKAQIIDFVIVSPDKIELLLNQGNAGLNEITLKSFDNKPFTIKSFNSTNNIITASFDSNDLASEFTLKPVVDVNKLQSQNPGSVNINLSHPKKMQATIPFRVLPKFNVSPPMISLFTSDFSKPINKTLTILNNYGNDFEIESTNSKKAFIKLLKQDKIDKGIKLTIQITPPTIRNTAFFSDTFYVNIKDQDQLKIKCSGRIRKNRTQRRKSPRKPKQAMNPKQFTVQPPSLVLIDAEPQKPVIREVYITSTENQPFEFISAKSREGSMSVVKSGKLENNRRKIDIQIIPPEKKENRHFSDILFLTIKLSEEPGTTKKIPVSCRGIFAGKSDTKKLR
ncbi:MAG: DUF1573 domain-containing protein [Planctomycetota bacterium]|jgi:hypothetical protein